jgi:hypothetical protein
MRCRLRRPARDVLPWSWLRQALGSGSVVVDLAGPGEDEVAGERAHQARRAVGQGVALAAFLDGAGDVVGARGVAVVVAHRGPELGAVLGVLRGQLGVEAGLAGLGVKVDAPVGLGAREIADEGVQDLAALLDVLAVEGLPAVGRLVGALERARAAALDGDVVRLGGGEIAAATAARGEQGGSEGGPEKLGTGSA